MDNADPDKIIEHWLQDNDISGMSLPDIEYEPHLLISKVRKHYMEEIIKLLSLNYEKNQRLVNKNIYLPSAIWRCAKILEMSAAKNSMLVELYRKNIVTVIKDLKSDTNNGKLYKKLSECLHKPPENDKKLQTSLTMPKDCTCTCTCYQRKKVRKFSEPFSMDHNRGILMDPNQQNIHNLLKESEITKGPDTSFQNCEIGVKCNAPMPESNDAEDVMQQLEKLFEGGSNEEDIFDGILCNSIDFSFNEGTKMSHNYVQDESCNTGRASLIEEQAAQIKSLDERLTTLTGVLENAIDNSKTEAIKHKKPSSNKWICEEYFLKVKLFELLDQLRDCNRAKLNRIKVLLADLFGEDSDDEGVVSPLDETPEFVASCKERITPWVVKLLTPYYVKGRIKGKALFKALARHLIRLIYQCSRYPEEYEVQNFIKDFLHNHKTIRCEADFKQFRIENI
ncbi:unnamed protein product [Colias eurytheme]|nr:unnamed protein product [Colias eurytheme]